MVSPFEEWKREHKLYFQSTFGKLVSGNINELENVNYLHALLHDYSAYVMTYEPITIDEFLEDWTYIPLSCIEIL